MNVIKCKMCGGDLEIKQGSTIAVCTYCGTQQTVLTADNERKTKLYNRAHELRLNNDFDQALGVFETIIAEFPDEAEAYWGLCLCKYGIEYVDDPITKLKVPTCHRTCYDSIMNDDDYRRAVDLAGITARNLYYNEAIQIDAIQRTILTIARNERPYDIFICYKESDGRQRTKDSVLAQDIYDALVDQGGYKVFFSRITLEDKLGEEFEPYIFSALNTAKVMLVVGTSNSNMNSVWVKNEWSRYLKLMKSDKSKLLIPCYADMDAYDLPEEFRNLQAQDMNKIGFMQDLLRGIKKVVNPSGAASEKTAVSTDINKLLKRIDNFIEENNWTSANEYCERVLDADPDNVQAYLYKLLIDKRVTEVKALKNCFDSFEGNVNYQRLTKIADEKLKLELKGYIDYIREKKNRERVAREKAERQRLAELEEQKKKRVQTVTKVSILVSIIILVFVSTVGTMLIVQKNNKYNQAIMLLNEGNYIESVACFEELGNYRNANELISEAKYQESKELINNGKISEAISILDGLGEYKDSREIIGDVEESYIIDILIQKKEYEEALSCIEKQKNVDPEKADDYLYKIAKSYFDDGRYQKSIEVLKKIRDTYMEQEIKAELMYSAMYEYCNQGSGEDYDPYVWRNYYKELSKNGSYDVSNLDCTLGCTMGIQIVFDDWAPSLDHIDVIDNVSKISRTRSLHMYIEDEDKGDENARWLSSGDKGVVIKIIYPDKTTEIYDFDTRLREWKDNSLSLGVLTVNLEYKDKILATNSIKITD
ncbi:MAG: toll/interleukin-1 receptor domain-containing protein [Lachnospiraceae bacterium]|nr:toll/interleukin-1 receptor domain-containing protein [Lachnospiraceae bacterium]